jgi:hypothetical protein
LTEQQVAFRPYNYVHEARYRGGWIGLFSGENQTKAIGRIVHDLNARGYRVAAMVQDRWSFWRRLIWAFVALITLFFVVRSPNVLIVSEPIPFAQNQPGQVAEATPALAPPTDIAPAEE